nr:MAG TPA: hypothetical protein [Caudoviricetes sp.]
MRIKIRIIHPVVNSLVGSIPNAIICDTDYNC